MKVTRTKAVAGTGAAAAAAFALMVALWQDKEGTELVAYRDSIGVWTICDGDTANVKPGMVETPEGCARRLDANMRKNWAAARRLVTAEMTYGQWIAYADFIGNAGEENFRNSSMRRYANQGRVPESCEAFLKWVYAGGRDCRDPKNNCRGIVYRRQTERAYCMGILP